MTFAEETEWGLPHIVQMVLDLSPFYTHMTGADGTIKHLYVYIHDVVQLTRYIMIDYMPSFESGLIIQE